MNIQGAGFDILKNPDKLYDWTGLKQSPGKAETTQTTKAPFVQKPKKEKDPFLEGFYSVADKPKEERRSYTSPFAKSRAILDSMSQTKPAKSVAVEEEDDFLKGFYSVADRPKDEAPISAQPPVVQKNTQTTYKPINWIRSTMTQPNLWYAKNTDLSPQKVNYASNTNARTGESRDAYDSRIRQQYAARERYIDFSDTEAMKNELSDIEAAKNHDFTSKWYKRLERAWDSGDLETYERVEKEMETQKKRIEYILENRDRMYKDNFTGQFGANYRAGRMSQDEALAWNEYLESPTLSNKEYAESIGETLNHFRRNNEETLADDATAPWLTQSFAGYLPQLSDQVKAGVEGAAAVGLTSGFMAGASGNPFVAGGALLNGAKAGYMGATAAHAYDVMRGSAYRNLIAKGMDEQSARAAANDEALISSLVELADSGVDISTVFDFLANPKLAGIKGTLKLLGKIGINALGESAEEGLQESVSIANEQRDSTGVLDLLNSTAGTWQDVLLNRDPDAQQRILSAMGEGAKLSLMTAGPTLVTGQVTNPYFNNIVNETANDDVVLNDGVSEEFYDIERQIKFPTMKYPGDDPSICPGDGFEWRGKHPPSNGLGAWYNPEVKVSMHWDLQHEYPIGPHWDYVDANKNHFRIYKDGRIELTRIGGKKI